MNTLKLRAFGTHFFGRVQGAVTRERIEALLSTVPKGGVLSLDLEGVRFFDYTFADEAIAATLQRLAEGTHGNRYLLLKIGRDAIGATLAENITVALERRQLCAWRFWPPDFPDPQCGDDLSECGEVLGTLPAQLEKTLHAFQCRPPSSIREFAEALDIDNVSALRTQIRILHGMGLLRCEKPGASHLLYSGLVHSG